MFTVCGIMHSLCCLLVTSIPPHPGHQQAASSVHYTTSCRHSLVLLVDGRNYLPKHVELIEIINNKIIIVASSWVFLNIIT